MTNRVSGRRPVIAVLCVTVLGVLLAAPPASAHTADDPPKLNLAAAERGLAAQQIYRAPGAVARYDRRQIQQALGPNMKLLVEPFTGLFAAGHNYTGENQYVDQVYSPLSTWADDHHVTLIDVTGLDVASLDGVAAGPSDIPELRRQTAYLDVTNALLAVIEHAKTGKDTFPSKPDNPLVAPTAAQLDAVVAHLRANRVYTAPGRPPAASVDAVTKRTGLTVRVAAFPPVPAGQPIVNYAPGLAKQFPNDEIFVSYGQWMEVAGAHQSALESARNYGYGRGEDAIMEWGTDPTSLIGLILDRVAELIRKHPFSRPQPTPFDLRHRISALSPWVLLGAAVLLGGGSLLAWRRHQAEAARAERVAFRRESALASASISALSAEVLHGHGGSADAAERLATASSLFDQASTAAAMREVRGIAEQAVAVMHR
ncbi:MAG TPA: hypothetical protein VFX16_26230 [Pseudonocardiaceae bacterium]|nr:hypothetical protein [Pseudonocardiaceae bacterium]